jgi:hypothetical protein
MSGVAGRPVMRWSEGEGFKEKELLRETLILRPPIMITEIGKSNFINLKLRDQKSPTPPIKGVQMTASLLKRIDDLG